MRRKGDDMSDHKRGTVDDWRRIEPQNGNGSKGAVKQNMGVLISMDFEVWMGGETRDVFNCEIDVSSK